MHAKPRRIHVGGSLLLVVVLVAGIGVLAPTVQQLVAQRQRIASLERDIADANAEIARLDEERARWDDPDYIRAQARERLLFVQPGEEIYLSLDDPSAAFAPEARTPSTEVEERARPWAKTLVDSIVIAGTSTDPTAGTTTPDGTAP